MKEVKRTLWEKFVGYWKGLTPAEVALPFYNPLKSNFGTGSYCYSVLIDTLEYRHKSFSVKSMKEHTLEYKGKKFTFTDYYLSPILQEGENPIKLRVMPHDSPGRDLQVLVLSLFDEIPYDMEFKSLLDDSQFNVLEENGTIEASFWRIDDVKSPYQARIKEKNHNGDVEEGLVWYWDYWRETKDEGGTLHKEFLFIEWDKSDTGIFSLWRGEEVPQACIFV